MDQSETSTVAELKLQVDNVVRSNREMEARVAAQCTCTTEQMVAKEISAFVAESLEAILQWAYENACPGFRSVIYKFAEQVLLDVLCRAMIGEPLDRHISTYFSSSDPADKVGVKPISTNSLIAPIAALI